MVPGIGVRLDLGAGLDLVASIGAGLDLVASLVAKVIGTTVNLPKIFVAYFGQEICLKAKILPVCNFV